MWSIVTRCNYHVDAYYPALASTIIQRGGWIIDAEWAKMIRVEHGPVLPNPRRGSRKLVEIRVRSEATGSRIDAVTETPIQALLLIASSVGALAAPPLTLLNPLAGLAAALLSAASSTSALLSTHLDFNWVASLLEEACEAAANFADKTRLAIHPECEPINSGYRCRLPEGDCEIVEVSLAALGFQRRGSEYIAPNGLCVRVEKSQACSLVIESRRMTPQAVYAIARLVALLAYG